MPSHLTHREKELFILALELEQCLAEECEHPVPTYQETATKLANELSFDILPDDIAECAKEAESS